MQYIYRNQTNALFESIKTRPLTYLNGGRQVGKSTLCAHLADSIAVNQITFDSPLMLSSAKSDPAAFIANLPANTLNIIDEVQFAPEIFPYLKMKVDENRLNGQNSGLYLLTGSANLMALPTLSDALVGRMSILTLYPFSASEYYQTNVNLIAKLFNDDLFVQSYDEYNILDAILHSTYPEIAQNSAINRTKWFDSYLTTILNRDVKSISDLKNPDTMVMLFSLLAMRTGGLLNNSAIASEIGIDYKTYEKMMSFALNSFMIFNIKPWAMPNKLNKRFVKSPKMYFTDSNFLSYIMKRSISNIYENDKITFGHIFENFVATELLKHAALCNIELSHVRTSAGKEADFVLENASGEIIGIEVKSSHSIDKKYLSGLQELKDLTGDNFKKGIILYAGKEVIPLSDKMWAVPASYLWRP